MPPPHVELTKHTRTGFGVFTLARQNTYVHGDHAPQSFTVQSVTGKPHCTDIDAGPLHRPLQTGGVTIVRVAVIVDGRHEPLHAEKLPHALHIQSTSAAPHACVCVNAGQPMPPQETCVVALLVMDCMPRLVAHVGEQLLHADQDPT
jgi:hypothetical protein